MFIEILWKVSYINLKQQVGIPNIIHPSTFCAYLSCAGLCRSGAYPGKNPGQGASPPQPYHNIVINCNVMCPLKLLIPCLLKQNRSSQINPASISTPFLCVFPFFASTHFEVKSSQFKLINVTKHTFTISTTHNF